MLVRYGTSWTPGMSGTRARPPTLMKIRGAVSCSSPTRTVSGPSNRAWPWMTVQPSMPRSHFSTPARALAETASARALTLPMSICDVAVQHDAVVGGAPREMRRVRAGDQRLGRHAAGVHAGAAEQLALDERDRHAGAGQPAGERRSGLAGPDDDGVEALHGSAAIMRAAAVGRQAAPSLLPTMAPPEPLR